VHTSASTDEAAGKQQGKKCRDSRWSPLRPEAAPEDTAQQQAPDQAPSPEPEQAPAPQRARRKRLKAEPEQQASQPEDAQTLPHAAAPAQAAPEQAPAASARAAHDKAAAAAAADAAPKQIAFACKAARETVLVAPGVARAFGAQDEQEAAPAPESSAGVKLVSRIIAQCAPPLIPTVVIVAQQPAEIHFLLLLQHALVVPFSSARLAVPYSSAH
jgi:hypothetical protein